MRALESECLKPEWVTDAPGTAGHPAQTPVQHAGLVAPTGLSLLHTVFPRSYMKQMKGFLGI